MHLDLSGFMSLLDLREHEASCFFSAGSCHRPHVYDRPEATVPYLSARFSLRLGGIADCPYVIVIARDCFRPDMSRKDREALLTRWIVRFVLPNPSPSAEVGCPRSAGRPRIDLEDDRARRVRTREVLSILPRYQLGGLTMPLRLYH